MRTVTFRVGLLVDIKFNKLNVPIVACLQVMNFEPFLGGIIFSVRIVESLIVSYSKIGKGYTFWNMKHETWKSQVATGTSYWVHIFLGGFPAMTFLGGFQWPNVLCLGHFGHRSPTLGSVFFGLFWGPKKNHHLVYLVGVPHVSHQPSFGTLGYCCRCFLRNFLGETKQQTQ